MSRTRTLLQHHRNKWGQPADIGTEDKCLACALSCAIEFDCPHWDEDYVPESETSYDPSTDEEMEEFDEEAPMQRVWLSADPENVMTHRELYFPELVQWPSPPPEGLDLNEVPTTPSPLPYKMTQEELNERRLAILRKIWNTQKTQ